MNSMYNDDEMKYFHDNEEKYFFPENEEIYLGYECEVFQLRGKDEDGEHRNKWYPHVVELEIDDYSDLYSTIMLSSEYRPLRTPYLTKEQLEAEGWYKVDDNFPIQKFKHPVQVDVEVIYNYNDHYLFITIPGIIMFVQPNIKYKANIFSGYCKDINTFRKICKLLKI